MSRSVQMIVVVAAMLCGTAAAFFLYDRWEASVAAQKRERDEVEQLITNTLDQMCRQKYGFRYKFEPSEGKSCAENNMVTCINDVYKVP